MILSLYDFTQKLALIFFYLFSVVLLADTSIYWQLFCYQLGTGMQMLHQVCALFMLDIISKPYKTKKKSFFNFLVSLILKVDQFKDRP